MRHALLLLGLGSFAGVLVAALEAPPGLVRSALPENDVGAVRFNEVARASGVEFQHFDPVTDSQFITETIGSGAPFSNSANCSATMPAPVAMDGTATSTVTLGAAAMSTRERSPARLGSSRRGANPARA